MQRTRLARWLVVGALAAFFLLAGASLALAQESVRGTNVATGSAGISGPVTGGNAGNAIGGPSAGPAFGGVASAQMDGDTSTTVEQNTVGASAPAVAGSQVTAPAPGTRTQGTNVSTGSLAVSGPVTVGSVAKTQSGPSAVAGLGSVAAAGQSGDVNTVVQQNTVGVSGPAIAGSQVVTGGTGDALTQGVNVSVGAASFSGPVTVFNVLGTATGPSSVALLGGTAVTGQVGNSDAYITQAAGGLSGAAVSGSQVTTNPIGRVQGFNLNTGAVSASGPVTTGNLLGTVTGPSAFAFGIGSTSTTTHLGNAGLAGSQTVGSTSGNAVTGSQVYGLASPELGVLDVPNQQASDPDFFQPSLLNLLDPSLAVPTDTDDTDLFSPSEELWPRPADQTDGTTGSANGTTGSNQSNSNQSTDRTQQQAEDGQPFGQDVIDAFRQIGDALSQWGNQVLAAIAGLLSGGLLDQVPDVPTDGQLPAQPADESNGSEQTDGAEATGPEADAAVNPDAADIPGIPGVPGVPSLTGSRVQNTNIAAGNVGLSGASTAINAGVATAGPSSRSVAVGAVEPASAVAATGMDGDAFTLLDQTSLSGSGDANVGSQVAKPGIGNRVQDLNVAAGHIGRTGNSTAVNAGAAQSGPTATAARLDSVPSTGRAVATAGQAGDANADLVQRVVATSGDAASGSQVSDLTAGVGVRQQNVNVSALGAAFTGPARAVNIGNVTAGPDAAAASFGLGPATLLIGTVATANQFGNDNALLVQGASASSGDAATGSQVTNLLGGLARLQNFNLSVLGLSSTGAANALNVGDQGTGPTARAGTIGAGATAASTQWGDNTAAGRQRARAMSGDGAAGSQILDAAVLGSLRSQDRNVSVAAAALTGRANATNFGSSDAGPVAAAGAVGSTVGGTLTAGHAISVAGQSGDNNAFWSQRTGAFSGDTLAGSQGNAVTGGRLQGLNVSVGSLGSSGTARSAAVLGNATGPAAISASVPGVGGEVGNAAAFAGQDGSNLFLGSQTGNALTGDTVAGSQLRTGTATGRRGQTRNISLGSAALSGGANHANVLGSNVGPAAAAVSTGVPALAASVHGGDGFLTSNQVGFVGSGNAVAGSQIDGTSILGLLQGTNVTAGSLALTGTVNGLNLAYGIAGPPALSLGGVSTAAQLGSDVGVVLQLFVATSGDVLSGADLPGLGWLTYLLTGRIAAPGGLWRPVVDVFPPVGDALT